MDPIQDTPQTPGLLLAARLRNLAEHYEAHPHLAEVSVHNYQDLQLSGHGRDKEGSLLAWADTMADRTCTATFLQYEGEGEVVHIVLVGTVNALRERVWDAIPGLAAWLRANGVVAAEPTHVDDFNLDLLREFAEAAAAARGFVATLDEVPS